MSALSDAVEVAQRKAIVALGSRFIRGAAEPKTDEYREMLNLLGCTDDTEVTWLIASWTVLREEKAAAPGEPVASRAAATEEKPASDRQWERIRRDCKTAGVEVPQGPLTMRQASETIEQLAAGTYEPVPF